MRMGKVLSSKDLLAKVEAVKKENPLDLSSDEDLAVGVMNLISIEEHLFFTIEKTGKSEYLDLLNRVREIRIEALRKLIRESEGEAWCTGKHLLAAAMRLMEVGTKALKKGDKKQAREWFDRSFEVFSLFWGVVSGRVAGREDTSEVNSEPDESRTGLVEWVKKALDCCKE